MKRTLTLLFTSFVTLNMFFILLSLNFLNENNTAYHIGLSRRLNEIKLAVFLAENKV